MVATKRQRRGRQKQKIRKTAKAHQAYPHDSFFKKIFKRPEYCRALMQIILQPKLYAIFDWALMKISESVSTGAKGAERRADIVLEVPLLNEKQRVIITIILEHKSYRDNNAILQMLGYYNEAAQETHNLILPIIITCCKDKKASIPSDYISWALQQQGAPAALKKLLRPLPNFDCPLVNLHSLSSRRMQRGGEAVCLALFGMRNYWNMDDDVVGKIIDKAHLLPQQERDFVLSVLIDYYERADKGYGRKGFARVERKRYPHLKEGEGLVTTVELGFDRAKQEGMRQGVRKGKQLGIEKGIKLGKLDTARQLLLDGYDEQAICRATKLSKKELAEIKRSLDQD